jgi:iron complex transport system ATP-binding protein
MALNIKNVDVQIAKKDLLNNINFNADAGSMHAIVGPNGAGKTTLLKTLAHLQTYSGSISFNQKELSSITPLERSRCMAYVPQFLPAVNLSVLEVLELARRPFGAPHKQRKHIDEQIEAFSLHHSLKTPLKALSGGERQMVMIAAALLQQPQLLLLDEPIAHLDPKNQLEVLQRLKDITYSQKITTLIVLHDLQHALHYCDNLLLLKEGKVQAHTTSKELEASHLSNLYGVDAKLFWHEGHPFVAFAHEHEHHHKSHQH